MRHGNKNPGKRYQARRQSTLTGSYLERGMGGRKTIAGGELCVFRQDKRSARQNKMRL